MLLNSDIVKSSVLIIIAAIFLYLMRWPVRPSRKKRLHRKNIKKSHELKEMFRKWGKPGLEARILVYLRKIDPLVFEELILSCLKDAGADIKRNRQYTVDGGIDGVFYINKERWLIQVKRYSSAINPQHVKDFSSVCNGTRGIFVHTSRTGRKS